VSDSTSKLWIPQSYPDSAPSREAASPSNGNGHTERLIKLEVQVAQLQEGLNDVKKDITENTVAIKALEKTIDAKFNALKPEFGALEKSIDAKFNALYKVTLPVIYGLLIVLTGGIILQFFR
jgi:flagellar motility protein MotE (MotC chaperone)